MHRKFGPEDTAAATLPAEHKTPAHARRLVRELCESRACPELAPVAELVTSELVTNAVVHTGTSVYVYAWVVARDHVRMHVADSSPMDPVPDRSPGHDQLGGRGLSIVDAVSRDWGYAPTSDGGKVVWAEVTADRHPTESQPRVGQLVGSSVAAATLPRGRRPSTGLMAKWLMEIADDDRVALLWAWQRCVRHARTTCVDPWTLASTWFVPAMLRQRGYDSYPGE